MKGAVCLFVVAACGRFGFDQTHHTSDAPILDGVDGGDGAGPPAFVAPWHSGPRLRARLLVGGGDPIFYGWHDTMLGTDCQPGGASDGVERCMPQLARADLLYSDAACTQRLAVVYRGTCGNNGYASLENGGIHEYVIGAAYTGPVYAMGANCGPAFAPSNADVRLLGAEEPPTSFLISSYHRQLVGNYDHSFNDFSDGASIDISTLVLASSSCSPTATEVGPVRCRANAKRATIGYLDPGCTNQILVWARTPYDPAATSTLAVFPPQACDSKYDYYQVTADVTTAKYYVKDSTGCTTVVTPTSTVLYSAMQVADPSPMGTVVRGPDRGRIGTLYWIGPDSIPVWVGNFDQQTGAPCTPFNASDGVLRCLPSRALAEPANENATCSGSVATIDGECFGAVPVEGPFYTSCNDNGWKVHALSAPTTAASIDYDGTCTAIDLPGGTAYDHATLGAEIAPSTFPSLIEMVE